jgi:hypothetical protein
VSSLIGDPTPLEWTITVGHALGALLSWAAARGARGRRTDSRILWLSLAWGEAVLALNKQLDLQVPLNDAGRELSHLLGVYRHRGVIQIAFLLCLLAAVALGLILLARRTRPWSSTVKAALAGATILAIHLVVRAASFDVYDVRTHFGRWNFYPLLELIGSTTIAAAAWSQRRDRDPEDLEEQSPANR